MESHSKVCSTCKEEKPRTEFNKHCRAKDGLRWECKACRSHYRKWNYQENRDRELERSKIRYQKNREHFLEYYKRRYRENREQKLDKAKRYYRENREQRLEYIKKWCKENPDKRATYNALRRASKFENTPDVIYNCSEESGRVEKIYKLRDLLTKATGVEYHVDHIWPLSKGGPHWSGNLQIITAEENFSKSDTLCEETARVIQGSLDEYISAR